MPQDPVQIMHPAKLSITMDGENRASHDKTTFRQYSYTNSAIHKMLKGKLQPKGDNHTKENTGNKLSQTSKSKEEKHTYTHHHHHHNNDNPTTPL